MEDKCLNVSTTPSVLLHPLETPPSATADDCAVVVVAAVLYIDELLKKLAPLAVVRVEDFELEEAVSGGMACGMEICDATSVAVEASSSSLRADTPIGVKALFSLFLSLLERG